MPSDSRKLIEAIGGIANERNVRVSVTEPTKGALVCAAFAFVGGILFGPVGLAFGGAAGGFAAYGMTSGKFRPLAEVLMNLTDEERERFVNHVLKAVADRGITNLAMLLNLLLNNAGIKQAVLNTAVSFVTNEMKMQLWCKA